MFVLLAVVGCMRNVDSVCEVEELEVEDDEVIDGVGLAAADALAVAEGVFVLPAAHADGTRTSVEVGVTRGEGASIHRDATLVSRKEVGFPSLEAPLCSDELVVPLALSAASSDGLIQLAGKVSLVAVLYGDDIGATVEAGIDADGSLTDAEPEGDAFWADFDGDGLYRTFTCTGDDVAGWDAPPGEAGC